jgi:hypothetical protein
MGINTRKYITNYTKIKSKESQVLPLIPNLPQDKILSIKKKCEEEGKPCRIIVLKARQMGISTITEAIIFKETATARNVRSCIVAHDEAATKNIFEMSKFILERLPPELKPQTKASNARELVFDGINGLGSKITVFTAGGKGVGRSATIQNLHVSEYAFWAGEKENTLLGLLQAVPNTPNTMVIIESTANGFDDFRQRYYDAKNGKSDYVAVFIGWHEMPEYRIHNVELELTIDEKELQKTYNLDMAQLAWRRWCIANNCGGDVEKFKQEYPINDAEAFISTGACIFDKDKVQRQLELQIKYEKRGRFIYAKKIRIVDNIEYPTIENIKWIDDPRGVIKIYEKPKEGYPYVMGGDTKGLGTDNYVVQVIDNTTGKQVAVYCENTTDDDLYAEQMYCLGLHYNTSLIAIEANFSVAPIRYLAKLQYPKIYVRQRLDTMTHKTVDEFGFLTTVATKPVMLSNLVAVVRDNPELIIDGETLDEMLTFIRMDNGKMGAIQGKKDDRVMALAIAHMAREQQSTKATVTTDEKKTFMSRYFGSKSQEESGYAKWNMGIRR